MWKPKFLREPCDDGDCLVKVACSLRNNTPWERGRKCPDYKKWARRTDKVQSVQAIINTFFFIGITLSFALWIGITFGWGIRQEYLYIRSLF